MTRTDCPLRAFGSSTPTTIDTMLRSGVRISQAAPKLLRFERGQFHTGKWRPGSVKRVKPQIIAVRLASTATGESSSLVVLMKTAFYGTSLILGLGLVYLYITDTRAGAHRWLVVPALRILYPDPEDAHKAGNSALRTLWHLGLYPRERGDPDKRGDLKIEVFGHTLANPIATSAGIDKHADIPNPLFAIGPSIIEIGGTTPMPQDGNEKPRVFRLSSQGALINRYGLNSEGADHVAMRLRQRVREFAHSMGLGHDAAAEAFVLDGHAGVPPGSLTNGKLLAVNIAKNKITPEHDVEAVERDYVYCVERLAPYADILVVNVSSPNTPGLRSLQRTKPLTKILTGVVKAAKEIDRQTKVAVMVKVSPDEDSDEQIAGICQAVWESGVDGVIVGNTTNRRPEPLPSLRPLSPVEKQTLLEHGGFSGPHLFDRTVALVKRYKKLLDQGPSPAIQDKSSRPELGSEAREIEESLKAASTHSNPSDALESSVDMGTIDHPKVIFATGGITNGKQALEVLNAGASVAMVYTALVYGGVGTISRIKNEMREEMNATKKAKNKVKMTTTTTTTAQS
jgi:dihydroorotate dehydrogenase